MTSYRLPSRCRLPLHIGLGLVVLLVGGCGPTPTAEELAEPQSQSPSQPAVPIAAEKPSAALSAGQPDSGEPLLWESPTQGVPLNLAYLPPGIQAIVAWRPAQTFGSDEGTASFDALGQFSRKLAADLEARLGIPLSQIDQLLIGLLDGELTDAGLGPPRMALVARCQQPLDVAALLPQWNSPQLRELSGQTYYEGSDLAWYLPADEQGRCLVITPRAAMPDVLELAGGAPPLRGELESLLAESDADRLWTVVFVPSFLVTGGKQLLVGPLAPLGESLDWMLSDQVLAVLGSGQLASDLFLEARLYTRPDVPSPRLERDLQSRLAHSAARLNDYLASRTPTPYAREVLDRLPRMWDLLVAQTRTAHQDRQVILRTYLPGVAAHNLALAANLALTEVERTDTQVASGNKPPAVTTIEERLDRPISLSFPRQTLEQAIELFASESGIATEILGGDLQLEGITKNQSFGLEAANLPARQVLAAILRQASSENKLTYVVRPHPQTNEPALYITTRAAAARRGEQIPDKSLPKSAN